MQIVESLAAFDTLAYLKPVLALGNFDGVHRGHQAIFHHVVARAQAIGGTSMVFTFEPHPLQVLAPEKAPLLLTTYEQKMRLINAIVPHKGVYAVRVEWDNRLYPGVANIGYNPTFGNQALSVEAHLFDVEANLYGATVRVEFLCRIRDERKFASVEELVAQIACDARYARDVHAQLATT